MLENFKIHVDAKRVNDWEGALRSTPGLQLTKSFDQYHIGINIREYNKTKPEKDLSYFDSPYAIMNLCRTFNLHPFKSFVSNVGFGVTVMPELPPGNIIGNVVRHKNKPFSIYRNGGKEFIYQQHRLRMYENGGNLKFEKYVNKNENLQRYGITVLADLLIPKKLYRLDQDLLKAYDELLIVESIPETALRFKDRKMINVLKSLQHDNQAESIPSRKRRRLMELVNSHSPTRIKTGVRKLILKQINELMTIDMQDVKELADFLWQFPIYQNLLEESKFSLPGEQMRRRLAEYMNKEGKSFSIGNYILGLYGDEEKFEGLDEIIALDTIFGIEHRPSIRYWIKEREEAVFENGYLVKCIWR